MEPPGEPPPLLSFSPASPSRALRRVAWMVAAAIGWAAPSGATQPVAPVAKPLTQAPAGEIPAPHDHPDPADPVAHAGERLKPDTWYLGPGVAVAVGVPFGGDVGGSGRVNDEFGAGLTGGLSLVFEIADLLQLAARMQAGQGFLNKAFYDEVFGGSNLADFLRRFGGVVRLQPFAWRGLRPFVVLSIQGELFAMVWDSDRGCAGFGGGGVDTCRVEYSGVSIAPGVGLRYEGLTAPTFGTDTADQWAIFLQADWAVDLLDKVRADVDTGELAGANPDLSHLWITLGMQYLL